MGLSGFCLCWHCVCPVRRVLSYSDKSLCSSAWRLLIEGIAHLAPFSSSAFQLCTVLAETRSFPALPTSWCTAACLPPWSAAACWAWSCCEPLTSCRCGKRYRGSRSCWPSGCLDAARPWGLWTLTSRPSSSVWRRHRWCTPAGRVNPEMNTRLLVWGRSRAVFLNP